MTGADARAPRRGRADLHIHTLASDGTASVAEVLDAVAAAGRLDVIAIADHERIEHQAFDGVLDPKGGVFRPDRSQPGTGLELKTRDIERFRRR